ncbi:MAG: phosphoglucosamine mutase [Elusimicrobiaceae bacterium]|jgi:phosphoglucosamine mutase|nr:phosphoglucosamine mutase [Elusimicrobiaceae bacterium]MBT3954655.1 phosphoglucosamine mutase [Elusimicrobiaceae bacterium]MBT4007726.1 phosphoglucosamine mutase [Elusimicrobiaceae bacterium]MBT4402829.1 phosphoglucosamine mutase [Elusimicrobiaceae bacterium]MBT4440085.1 phosphoglucosamine mutase [Elusimicrobiaceae bacterium]
MKYFGTDGIRAIAGQHPLVKDFVEKLGFVSAQIIPKEEHNENKTIIIAQDSRVSGSQITDWLCTGIRGAGYSVINIGIAPTPAVAFLTKKLKHPFGVMVSASHNPAEFNGIKFFDQEGKKLSESIEAKIETAVDSQEDLPEILDNTIKTDDDTLISLYSTHLKDSINNITFDKTKLVLDCANGATSTIAPQLFEELGFDIDTICCQPNGKNINQDCGATAPGETFRLVKKTEETIGVTFDGDGDRVIMCDENGEEIDGDDIILISALYLKEKGFLKENKVVVTVMSNLGLINYLKSCGITCEITQVGDKYVFEKLQEQNLAIGGENSGHIIFKKFSDTGDGILSALQILKILKEKNQKLSYYKKLWKRYSQKLVGIDVEEKIPLENIDGFLQKQKEFETSLNGKGRIFTRYSGTEPKLRILVECEDANKAEQIAKSLQKFYKEKVS